MIHLRLASNVYNMLVLFEPEYYRRETFGFRLFSSRYRYLSKSGF